MSISHKNLVRENVKNIIRDSHVLLFAQKNKKRSALFFCMFFRMPVAASAFYIRRFSNDQSRDYSINITKQIHNQFIEILELAGWVDTDSRDASIRKVKATKLIFGYSDELTNDTLLNEYYKHLDIRKTDSFLDSMLRVQRFIKNYQLAQLRMPAKLYDWTEKAWMATSVGVRYFPHGNLLCVILHISFCLIQYFSHF